jgi:hypothetical protein
MMGTIHSPPLLTSTTKITMVLPTGLPITTLNPPITVHPVGADRLATEETKSVMGRTSDSPVLALMVLQIVVGVATSITHNGLPLGPMVVVARLAPVHIRTAHKPLPVGHCQQMTHSLLVRLSPRTGPSLGVGPSREKMIGLRLYRRSLLPRTCLLRIVSHRFQPLPKRAESSALPSRQRLRLHLPRSLFPILRSECECVSHHLARLQLTHRPPAIV